jgi:Tfp pilus assembly protein PilO
VTRTTRLLIGVVLIAAAGAAYWMLLLSPKRKDAADLETKISVVQAQVAQAQQTLAEYKGAKAKYANDYAQIVRLGKATPADDDTRSLVVQVDAAAKRSGIDFQTIDLVSGAAAPAAGSTVATASASSGTLAPGAVNEGAFAQLPFNLTFTGEYAELGNFFSRIERFVTLRGDQVEVNGRLLRIEQIELLPAADGWPFIQANVGASAYIVPKDADKTAGATATGPSGTTAAAGSTTTTSTTPTTTTPSTSTASDLPSNR